MRTHSLENYVENYVAKEIMLPQLASLPRQVFDVIVCRLRGRAQDIARFTATKYSFEEWLNWEAYAACEQVSGWRAHPKPRYCDLGATDCKDFGDLMVMQNETMLLVEIGLVHDGTGDKWRGKLEWDVQKLARPLNRVTCLQIVLLVSGSNIEASEKWQRWLGKVPCWGRPNALEDKLSLPPKGQMVIRAWTGLP